MNIYIQLALCISFFLPFFLSFFLFLWYFKDSIHKELTEFVFKTAMVLFYYTAGYFNDEEECS
jgi:hypothetical protein